LRDEARRFLADRCLPAVPRRILDTPEPYAADLWQAMAELGCQGAAIPEEFVGVGPGRLAVCVLAEELGRAVAPVPFASSVYLVTEALMLFGSDTQKEEWLPRLATGQATGTRPQPAPGRCNNVPRNRGEQLQINNSRQESSQIIHGPRGSDHATLIANGGLFSSVSRLQHGIY
jgi:hypothetical protein